MPDLVAQEHRDEDSGGRGRAKKQKSGFVRVLELQMGFKTK